jgi:c-di-GMP-binding flagellar brake protein YcgR
MHPPDHQRRLHPRIDLSLEVLYAKDQAELEQGGKHAELFDLSPTGLRIEIEHDVAIQSTLYIRIIGSDDEEFDTLAEVLWARPRQAPSGRKVYDVGLRFEKNLLAQHRGPLATALAHLLAIQEVEPARGYDRIDIEFQAESLDHPALAFQLRDISPGGMRFTAEGQIGNLIQKGQRMALFIHLDGKEILVPATIAWVAGQIDLGNATDSSLKDSFGIDFLTISDEAALTIENIMENKAQPSRLVLTFQPHV